MKKIYSILLILFVVSLGYSQTNGITYQAVILNPDTEQIPGVDLKAVPMANKDICIQFSIIDNNSVIEYQESIQTKTDNFGMVNLLIGTGDKTDGYATSFAKINWGLASKNLKVAFNANGSCSDYIEISNQPFSAVPYALSTNMANITDGSIAGSKIESLSTDKITGILTIANGGTGANTIADAKANFGLENLDNTSDANKPVSIATQIALENEAKRTNNIENTLTAKLDTKVDKVVGKSLIADSEINRLLTLTNSDTNKAYVDGAVAAITRTTLGLENVNNTNDLLKPLSTATQTALGAKVDIVVGKTLSTNDYTNAEKSKLANIIGTNTGDQDLSNYATTSATNTALSSKVDVVTGKTLSTNDYTNAEKTKLAAIAGTNTGDQDLSSYALLASPTFTGTVTLPTGTIAITQTATNNSTAVATTAFVTSAIATATTGNFIDLTTNQTIAGTKTFSSNISTNSVIIGKGAGLTSVMTGTGSIAANGDNSTAIGNNTIANGDNSTAIGYGTVATADNTIRLGNADITNVQTSGTITAGAITYPNIDADNGYILTTNGAGIASFTAPAKTVTEAADEFSTENSNAVVAGTTDFTLTQNVASSSKVKMFINGVRISNTAYSVMAETKALTYNPANNGGYTIVAGDRIQFDYTY